MLVLARRRQERIVIDGSVTVRVIEIRGGRVLLGIDAPAHVPIRRAEIARTKCSSEAPGCLRR